ncbi:MAG: hypothetical protein EA402_10645 [Planctomycetota bacterium]|nr:MAG: hypothetical protein EA402_10645 [Planctomycetota bacterium]
MPSPLPQRDEHLAATIDAEAVDERESRATKELYQALLQHRQALSGGGSISGEDRAFSESVHREASRRSAEITAYRGHSSALKPVDGKPVPRWVIAAWVIAAILGLALALMAFT